MPVATPYPGVYIQEIPSGVRTITGVATSITAFVGRARRGPVDKATTITSYADFERVFGGLWSESTLGYAVRDFYLNGGSQAIIVRLYNPTYLTDDDRNKAEAASTATAKAATDKAGAANATVAEVVTAASNQAMTYETEPEVTAANGVVAAVKAASTAGAVVTDVTDAADAAAKKIPDGATNDEKAVKAAAADTAKAATGPDPAAAAAFARAQADTYTAADQKAAADAVATAAETAAGAGATVAGVAKSATAAASVVTKASLAIGDATLEARYEGAWANGLRARIDHDVVPGDASLFNLTVRDGSTGDIEVFRNVSTVPGHVRQVDTVLADESRLVRMPEGPPSTRPAASKPLDRTKGQRDVWADNDPPTNEKVQEQASDGGLLTEADFTGTGKEAAKKGLYALRDADLVNLLCIPPYRQDGNVDGGLLTDAVRFCEDHRAMLLIDPPTAWRSVDTVDVDHLNVFSNHAAVYFPRLRQPDPERQGQIGTFVPCGAVAGVMARTDSARGVWKAPAGLDATLVGVPELAVQLTDAENGLLNPQGVNCLRTMPAAGRVVWGARTREGDDRRASEWKYVPVRRTALFIEESLYRGTQWVVFEPNDEPLWAQIRLNLGAFMHTLFRQGAFQGKSPQEAYFVRCDKDTTTQNDINLGIVNIVVGFAPLKPAEFVVISIQQIAGQIQV